MTAITAGGDGGVHAGAELAAFAEALISLDTVAVSQAITALRTAVGDAGWVDAAGVAATFNAIDRVADATGIPLEDKKAQISTDLRDQMGVNAFSDNRL